MADFHEAVAMKIDGRLAERRATRIGFAL